MPSTTFAVFLAAPGTVSSSSMVFGTSPPNSARILFAAPTTDFALLLKKPGGFDILRQHFRLNGSEILDRRVLREQSRCHHVHALIRALRRENRGHQKFPG